jgi:hypothetical protein
MKYKNAVVFVAVWTAVFFSHSMARACAVCLTGAGDATTDAFNWSVLFLMAMPYLVVFSIAACLVYTYRRSAATQQREEAVSRPLTHFALNQEESVR